MSKRTIHMTSGSPAGHILNFAVPLILTNMGQQLYMIADSAIVGRGVGVKALAAVGATDWSYWLILWTVGGLTGAFATFVSRSFGEENYMDMNKFIASSVVLCAIIGGLLTVLGLTCAKPLLLLLNTPADILQSAVTYLSIMVLGTPVVTGYNMAGSILRALGDGKTPLAAMVIAALLNLGLDCLFVFVFQWGIVGAAAASVIAQLVSFLYCAATIAKTDCIRLDRAAWQLDWPRLKSMLVFGLPVAMQYVIITSGGIILQSSINMQGSIFIAGYTATNKLYSLLQCFAMSFGQATCTFLAQNYGAGLHDRVRKGVRDAMIIVTVTALIIMAVTLLTRQYILRVFLDVNAAGGYEALEVAVRYVTIMVLCFPILHPLYVYRNALQAMGIAVWFLWSGVAELIARILMSKVFLQIIGTDALFIAEPASWLGALLCVMLPYFYYEKTLLKPE